MKILQKYQTKIGTIVRSVTKDYLENKCLARGQSSHHTSSKITKTIRVSTKMTFRPKDKGHRLKVSKRWCKKVRHRNQINKAASMSEGIRKLYANSKIVIPQLARWLKTMRMLVHCNTNSVVSHLLKT